MSAGAMRVVFFGSGDIGVPALRWLLDAPGVEVAGVVTQPDRAAGRGLRVAPSPVKQLSQARGVPVLQPARVRDAAVVAEIAGLGAGLFVVMAYGQILPQAVLDLPAAGAINLHASLLPRHRGAAPVHAALLAGDEKSGITVMWVDAGVDTGDILLKRECPVLPGDTAGDLHDRLAALAPEALSAAVGLIRDGRAPRTKQDGALATHAPKLTRDSGRIDWQESAEAIARRVRALHPWPGCTAELESADGRRIAVKLHKALAEEGSAAPGELTGGLRVGCGGGGLLRIVELQAAGGKRLEAAEFLRGHAVARAVCAPAAKGGKGR